MNLKKLSLKQWSLQKKIMLGLGVYLVLALIVGINYALKPYYEGYVILRESLGSMSEADQQFLIELMRELDEELQYAGPAGTNGSTGGVGSAGGFTGGVGSPGAGGAGSADGSPDGSAAGLDPGLYLPGGYDANGSPIAGSYSAESLNPNGRPDFLNDPELKALARKISLNDQMRALEIVRPSLSDADMDRLVAWVKGGITASEKAEIKKLLKARLTAEQIAQLRELYNKYYG